MVAIYGKIAMNCRDFGVSEVYAMAQSTMTSALSSLEGIVAARRALLCADVTIIHASVSDSAVRGDSKISSLEPLVGTYTTGTPNTYRGDQGELIRSTSADFVNRSVRCLRLIPNTCFDAGGGLVPVAGWQTLLDAFLALLKSDTMIPKKKTNPPPAHDFVAIDTIIAEGQGSRKVGRPFGLQVGHRLIR